MAGTFTSLFSHVVFSTQNREPMIHPTWAPRIHKYMSGILADYDEALLRIGGMADHVHLLLRLKPDVAVADVVRIEKANTSKWLNELEEYPGSFVWQRGYGAFTVSKSQVNSVIQYVENQQEHHRYRSFQEEFRDFLTRHEIEYDERYIWQ